MLWAYRTTRQKPTGESPFALTYGMEAIIPMEIRMPTVRMKVHVEASAKAILKDLDTTDELQEAAAVRISSYQQRLASWHNRRVKPRTFKAKELVLRRVFKNMSKLVDGKFEHRVGTIGSYALSRQDGTTVPKMWNAMHLKKYYQ